MTATKACRKRRKKATQQQRPLWLSNPQRMVMNAMKKCTPPGYNVDHIVPLLGITVSGLDVPWNTQIVTKEENTKKGNRWPSDLLWSVEELKELFGFRMRYLRIGAPKGCFTGRRK